MWKILVCKTNSHDWRICYSFFQGDKKSSSGSIKENYAQTPKMMVEYSQFMKG